MRLFNLNDVIFSEKLLYLLSKSSKAVAKASILDFSFNKPLFNSLRSRYTDYSHNYFRLYHLLGEYKWEVVLIVKLAKVKQKLGSLLKRG